MGRALIRNAAALCGLLLSAAAASPAAVAAGPREAFSYDAYARVLASRVDGRGLVDYRGLKQDPRDLRAFVVALARLDRAAYERWPEPDRIAFWINAYNALTLQAIVDHYPIRPSLLRSVMYPKNSIRQIPGVWDEIEFVVMGRRVTLDHIEHEILRKEFREPRIHMALVCAAMGCPALRREPYAGDRLDAQLEDQAARFLAEPTKLRLDRASRTIHLSPIFKWFGEDFLKAYGRALELLVERPHVKQAVVSFVAKRLPPDSWRELETGAWSVAYLDYDWSLNEQ